MVHTPAAPTVSQDVTLHCLDDGGRDLAFVASLGYNIDDPYAVWLTFHIPGGDVSWAVGRSLLLEGLTEPTGDGDIRLRPGLDDEGHAVTILDFHSPSGSLSTQARTVVLRTFLERTWLVVPPGDEAEQLDLDLLVGALLGWSEAE